ncbi:MAG: phosphohistidine phosphatase SixA [Bacteroidales bacterium]|nr:phosphohistidine phosphatase SixA [Bacteroidales bacterium]
MKILYIVRHAKSSWDHPGLSDHERPLLEKGKKRTKKVIDFLLEKNIQVDLIISSYAVRAFETATIIAKALKYPEEQIQKSTNIYHGDVDNLFNHFYDLSDNVKSLMLVGHNPTFTNFANYFMDEKIDWLATSGIVCIEFKTDSWENILQAEKKTKFVITPKKMDLMKKRKSKSKGK